MGAGEGMGPDHRERRKRERESKAWGIAQGKHIPKPFTGKMRRADYHEFLQTVELKY